MEPTKNLPNKKAFNEESLIGYIKKWTSIVILKTFVDLLLGLALVFVFFSIGYILSNITSLFQTEAISVVVKRASIILAFCYLVAILITTGIRVYALIRRDFTTLKTKSIKSPDSTAKQDGKKKGK